MGSRPVHITILEALAVSEDDRIDGLRALTFATSGELPSPNAEIHTARDVAIAVELLALRGLVQIDRDHPKPRFTLTPLGKAFMRPRTTAGVVPTLSGAVALTTALSGCAQLVASTAPPAVAGASLKDLRQLPSSHIEQVVDPVSGARYFARCSECPQPTPKTLASSSQERPTADILQYMPPEVLARAGIAEAPIRVASQAATGATTYVERRYVVYFRFGESSVDPSAQVALQKLVSQLTGAKSILIVGSTDSTGDVAVNRRLAEKRAAAVAAAFKNVTAIETRAEPNRQVAGGSAGTVLGKAPPKTASAALARHAEIVAFVPSNLPQVAAAR